MFAFLYSKLERFLTSQAWVRSPSYENLLKAGRQQKKFKAYNWIFKLASWTEFKIRPYRKYFY